LFNGGEMQKNAAQLCALNFSQGFYFYQNQPYPIPPGENTPLSSNQTGPRLNRLTIEKTNTLWANPVLRLAALTQKALRE
jgi:hypothetical protein